MKSTQLKTTKSGTQNKKYYYRKLFTFEEDSKLMILVEKYNNNWKKIASEMKDRSVRQCKERYFHYLSPDIKRDVWTNEEDLLLLSSVEKHGKKWKALEYIFDGRTEIDIRNRFNVLTRRISRKIRKESQKANTEKKNTNDLNSKKDESKNSNQSELQNDEKQAVDHAKDKNKKNHSPNNVFNFFENADEDIASDISDESFDDLTVDFCF